MYNMFHRIWRNNKTNVQFLLHATVMMRALPIVNFTSVLYLSKYQEMTTKIHIQSDGDDGQYELFSSKEPQQMHHHQHHSNKMKMQTISLTNIFFSQDSDRDCNYELYLVQS